MGGNSDDNGNGDTPSGNDDGFFLRDSELAGTFDKIIAEFNKETDRGAVLIAADVLADSLEQTILHLRPSGFVESKLKDLLQYPGPLATLSSRSDIAFLSGFITETAHSSINHLRKLRNEAAHSQVSFSLANYQQRLDAICNLGPGVRDAIAQYAVKARIDSLVVSLLDRGREIEAEQGYNPFPTAEAISEYLKGERAQILEVPVPKWELAFGTWLLLGLILHHRKHILAKRSKGVSTQSFGHTE